MQAAASQLLFALQLVHQLLHLLADAMQLLAVVAILAHHVIAISMVVSMVISIALQPLIRAAVQLLQLAAPAACNSVDVKCWLMP